MILKVKFSKWGNVDGPGIKVLQAPENKYAYIDTYTYLNICIYWWK